MVARYRFLFIEDQKDDALLLAHCLQSADFAFDWRQIDTEQALKSALDESWDMVLSDYTMPGFNGIRALNIVREKEPNLPFIFVSGTIGEERAVEAMRLGAQDFVMKGNVIRLIPAVERELQKQEVHRRHQVTESERTRFADILRMTPDLIAICTKDGRIKYMNESGRKITDMSSESQLTRRNIIEIFPDSDRLRFMSEILSTVHQKGLWTGESRLFVKDNSPLLFSIVVLAHRDATGEIDHLSIMARDISEREALEEKLQYKATHDNLTGLPNRYLFTDRFTTELQRARRNSKCVGVLFLDLDNFKQVNDSLGHEAGDALIQQVGRRLQASIRPNDTVARIGGDEFIILTGDLDAPESMLAILHRLKKSFAVPVLINSHELFITFSAGIALYPHDGDEVAELLRNADVAMYKAKKLGANQYCFYTSEMD